MTTAVAHFQTQFHPLLYDVLKAHGCYSSDFVFEDMAVEEYRTYSRDFKSTAVFRNFRSFADRLGREDWGLVIGECINLASLGNMGYAVISAPNLLYSLNMLTRFPVLGAWFFTFSIEEKEGFTSVGFTPNCDLHGLEYGLADIAISMLCQRIFSIYPMYKERVEIHFQGEERSYIDRLRQSYPGPLHFGQERYSVKVPTEFCVEASRFYSKEIWELSVQACKKQVSMINYLDTADPVEAVRESIEAVIAENYRKRPAFDPLPNIDQVAKELNLTEASLRQYLRSQKCQFRQIKEESRRKWLVKLLKEPELSIQVIGFILGYQDASNFTRSCVAWFGVTPRQLRQQLGEQPA